MSGTMTVMKPPACPARTPAKLSSSTSEQEGSTPIWRAASKKTSGSGLECSTCSPLTAAAKQSAMPDWARLFWMSSTALDEATARLAVALAVKYGLRAADAAHLATAVASGADLDDSQGCALV